MATRGDSLRYGAGLLTLSFHALCLPATAQTLHTLTIGEALIPALKHMPKIRNFGSVGNDVAVKWLLSDGNSFSATALPDTGRIVFMEEGRDTASAANDYPVPGLVLGTATLIDIRRRFDSNGIGFASDAESLQDRSLIGINRYGLHHAPGIFVAFVTLLASSGRDQQPVSNRPVMACSYRSWSRKRPVCRRSGAISFSLTRVIDRLMFRAWLPATEASAARTYSRGEPWCRSLG